MHRVFALHLTWTLGLENTMMDSVPITKLLLNLASWSRKHHVGLCTDYQKRLACGEVKSCVMAGRIHPLIFQSREDRAFARHLTWLLDPARA